MKFSKLALVSSVAAATLAIAGQAAAFAPVWTTHKDTGFTGADGATVVLWHGGATASTSSLQTAVVSTFCDPAFSVDILEDARAYEKDNGVPPSEVPTATEAGKAKPSFWAVACTGKAGLDPSLVGKAIIWNKRDDGGSGVGVGPLALSKEIGFMKPSTGRGLDGLPDTADDTNCPGDGVTNASGFTVNTYSRTVAGISATVHNCFNFTYDPVTHVAATVSESANHDDAVLRIPDIGTSDIEPDKFTDSFPENVPTSDFNMDGVVDGSDVLASYTTGTLPKDAVGFLTFGVLQNLKMYQDFQRVQFPTGHPLSSKCNPDGADYSKDRIDGVTVHAGGIADSRNFANAEECMPSMSAAEIRSVFGTLGAIREAGDMQGEKTYGSGVMEALDDNAPVWGTTGTLVGTSDTSIQICRRVKGSGTQAQFNAIMLGYPCDPTFDNSIDTVVPEPAGFFTPFVTENEGSGDVEKCANEFNDGTVSGRNPGGLTRWAMGINSLEKNAPSSTTFSYTNKYRFIKIDGFAPNLANVHAGDYFDYASQSIQTPPLASVNGGRTVTQAAFSKLRDALKSATLLATLNKTHAFGKAGWLAIPDDTLNPPTASLVESTPVSWYKRVSSGGTSNTCAQPSMFLPASGVAHGTVGPANCASDGGTDKNCYTP